MLENIKTTKGKDQNDQNDQTANQVEQIFSQTTEPTNDQKYFEKITHHAQSTLNHEATLQDHDDF